MSLLRPFRVFNDVKDVRMIWKFGGTRLGGFSQIAMLLSMAVGVALVSTVGLLPAALVFGACFVVITTYATVLSRLDETGRLSETTLLKSIRNGIRHRHNANFDLPEL